jgi:hypothetical protein
LIKNFKLKINNYAYGVCVGVVVGRGFPPSVVGGVSGVIVGVGVGALVGIMVASGAGILTGGVCFGRLACGGLVDRVV